MKLISRNDIGIMRKLRDAINKEFSVDFKISDSDFINEIYPFVLDSVNESLYDEFCNLESVIDASESKDKDKGKSKATKFYRGQPVRD